MKKEKTPAAHGLFKKLILISMALLMIGTAKAANITSNAVTGNWNAPASWVGGVVPVAIDNVTIVNGANITMTAAVTQTGTITVNNGGTLTLAANLTANGNVSITGTLITGTNVVNGTGSFTLTNNNPITATLQIGHADGIAAAGATGAIQNTGTRTFNSNSHYIYNGTTNQITGTGLPATVGLLTIANTGTAGNNIVSLTNNNTEVRANPGGTLTLTSGIFNIGTGNNLRFNNNSGANTILNNGGNFATTGTNGSDGGTVIVLQGSGANFNINGTSSTTFYNLQIGLTPGNGNRHVVQNAGVLINGTLTIQDQQCQWQTNAPIYGPNSTLYMNTNGGTFSLQPNGNANQQQWLPMASGTIGVTPGYPNNVTLTNIGTSQGGYNNGNGWVSTVNWAINGVFTLGDNVTNAQVDFSGVPSFVCGGFVLNTNSRFTAPTATMTVNGNWTNNQVVSGTNRGFFIRGTSTVNFGGTGTCAAPNTIQAPAGNSETFYNMGVVNGTYVQLNSPVIVTNTLNLTSGIIATSATNTLTVTNTSTAAVTGGGLAAYVNGPLRWNMQAGTGVYNFPVGSNPACANYFLPISLNKPASSAATATVQAHTPGSGGTVDATMSSLSTTEYWSLSTSAALPAGATVSVGRPVAIAPFAYIAESTTSSSGTYTAIGGTASTFGITNSNDIGAGSSFYFTLGSPPIVSTLAATSITTTSATLNGAFNTMGATNTTSFNYGTTASYGTNLTSLHSPINSITSVLDSQYVTGLTPNTIYHYQATDGVNSGSDVIFITAPNPPVVGTPHTPTNTGFTATWTAPAAMGTAPYTYTIEVSTDPAFGTVVATQTGISSAATSYTFTTLASGTQYYYRVRAVNATAASTWSATSTPISTLIVATTPCTSGNGSPGTTGTISSASSAPVIDGAIDPVWSTVPSNVINQKINIADEGSGLQGTPNNSSTWKTIWDATNLYILVEVTDATLVSRGAMTGATDIFTLNGGANLWASDGIEFYLDGNNNKGGAYDNTNDFQLRFNLGSPTVTGVGNAPFASLAPRISFSMVVIPGGYLLEAAIPWTGAGGINSGAYPSIAPGNTIGIDFSINDNDGTAWRTAQQGWYDGLGGYVDQYNNTTRFGTATLATCPQPPIVILPTVTNITSTGATLGATVSSSGDSPLTVRGTGITASPTTTGTANAVPEGGTAVSIYSGPSRTGLTPQTQYYYLGYATNTNGGTGVSNVASFFTLSSLPTVQPTMTANACTQMILNWTTITFPPVSEATQTGYLVLRSVAPAMPSTAGIATRVATTQGALAAGTTLVTTISSGATLTYTDATAVAGTTYNYMLIPFTWDGVVADSTFNYFLTSPATVNASIGTGGVAAPTASVTQQPTCAVPTGTITINPWDNTLTYSVDGTNYLAGPTFSGLTPNTYNVTARNASGCTSTATAVTVNTAPTTPAAPTANPVHPTCTVATGSITITAVAGLTYSIDGTNYFAANDPAFTGLAPNTYNVTARNAGGCTSSQTSVTINAAPTTPPAPGASATTQPTCAVPTGTITINPLDNTLTYSVDGTNFAAGPTFSGLAPTTYNVVARNSSGCTSAATSVTINAVPAGPSVPVASATQQPSCAAPTGTITINPWDNTLTYSVDGINYAAGPDFTGLVAGTYNVTARNGLGCTSTATEVIITPVSDAPAAPAVTPVQPTCEVLTGSVTITQTAGMTYSIDGVNYFAATDATFLNLSVGTYSITARNTTGCISNATIVSLIACVPDVFIPNLVTPNGDGKNDEFAISHLPEGSALDIFNRWGDRVYRSSNYDNLWAGSSTDDGVYYYDLTLPDGKTYKGWLNVIR